MTQIPIATSSAVCLTAGDLTGVCDELNAQFDAQPDLIVASYSSLCDTDEISRVLAQKFPRAAVMGASTCRASMTQEGLLTFGTPNVSLWGLQDADGAFGVGFASYDTSIEAAAASALQAATLQAGRPGELPDLIWIHSSPGHEEAAVATLDRLLGHDVSIVGGSAADENLEALWSCFAGVDQTSNGIALAVFFTSYEVSTSFQCGYMPTESHGIATRTEGRTVFEIDDQPAATVYNRWAGNLVDLSHSTLPTNVLGLSTLNPVGIAVGELSGIPYYNLAHPETITEDLALTFFCEIDQGQPLTLMSGTPDNIISRPGRVANEAIHGGMDTTTEVLGGLVVFCGGCLLAVESRAQEISANLADNLEHKPFMGCFTFGEQGRFSGGENRHGNLMVSVTVFRR